MNKLYGIIEYTKEVNDDQQQAVFTGTHGKHGTKTHKSATTKLVKASRLVVDNDYLVKSVFIKKLNDVAKELDGHVRVVSYFAN